MQSRRSLGIQYEVAKTFLPGRQSSSTNRQVRYGPDGCGVTLRSSGPAGLLLLSSSSGGGGAPHQGSRLLESSTAAAFTFDGHHCEGSSPRRRDRFRYQVDRGSTIPAEQAEAEHLRSQSVATGGDHSLTGYRAVVVTVAALGEPGLSSVPGRSDSVCSGSGGAGNNAQVRSLWPALDFHACPPCPAVRRWGVSMGSMACRPPFAAGSRSCSCAGILDCGNEGTGRLEASVAPHDAAPRVVIAVSMPFQQALPDRVAADQTARPPRRELPASRQRKTRIPRVSI